MGGLGQCCGQVSIRLLRATGGAVCQLETSWLGTDLEAGSVLQMMKMGSVVILACPNDTERVAAV